MLHILFNFHSVLCAFIYLKYSFCLFLLIRVLYNFQVIWDIILSFCNWSHLFDFVMVIEYTLCALHYFKYVYVYFIGYNLEPIGWLDSDGAVDFLSIMSISCWEEDSDDPNNNCGKVYAPFSFIYFEALLFGAYLFRITIFWWIHPFITM